MLSDIAKSVWKKHPWYGAGTGAFRLHAPFIATKEELKSFQRHKDDWRTLLISQQMKDASKRAREKGRDAVSDFDWMAVRPYNRNPVCAFNSYWTLLAERGLLGVVLIVLGLGVLAFSYVARLVQACLYLRTQDDADVFVFACPPIVWATPFAVALLLVLALYEPILEIAPMLLVCAVPLAVAAASFPKKPTPRPLAVQTFEGESR